MRENLTTIAERLSRCGLLAHLVERHVTKVEAWRKAHSKIRRKRLYDHQPISSSGHNLKLSRSTLT
jgi:hypothetical protein